MDRRMMLLVLVISSLALSACSKIALNFQTEGTLQGHVDIGPLCPTTQGTPSPNCLPNADIYKSINIAVWREEQSIKSASAVLDERGNFEVKLHEGNYLVDFDKPRPHFADSNMPMFVVINPDETTFVNVTIDTGIR